MVKAVASWLAGCLVASLSVAQPLILVHEGLEASGTIDGSPFGSVTPVPFRIIAWADARDVNVNGDAFIVTHEEARIEIDGVGTYRFLIPTKTFINFTNDIVGFALAPCCDLFDGSGSAAFAGWDLTTPIGPVTEESYLFQWGYATVTTDGGTLVLDDRTTTGTFTALEAVLIEQEGSAGSGTFDAVPFGDPDPVAFFVTAVGALVDVQDVGGGVLSMDHAFARIGIEGIGILDVLSSTRHFRVGSVVGLSHGGAFGPDLYYAPEDARLECWRMDRSLETIAGTGSLLQWGLHPVTTEGGELVFDSGEVPSTLSAFARAIFTDGFESGNEACWSASTVP